MKILKKVTINLSMIFAIIGMLSMSSCQDPGGGGLTPPSSPVIESVINVETPGTLSQAIRKMGIDSLNIKKLTLSGTLNGADVLCLRQMAGGGRESFQKTRGQLRDLNFLNVSFDDDATVYFIDSQTSKGYSIVNENALPDFMFSFCSLKSFNILLANTTTAIGDYAFYNNSSLTDVSFPAGIAHIGISTFMGARKLRNIHFAKGLKCIHKDAFRGCTSLINIDIPEGVKLIDSNAFVECQLLRSIKLPNSLKKLGSTVFKGCCSLKSITIPEGITSIPDDAFDKCSNLAQVVLPTNLTKIGKDAFRHCTSLESINLPTSVKSIGKEAFAGCSKSLEMMK